jgi:hypothetical protein
MPMRIWNTVYKIELRICSVRETSRVPSAAGKNGIILKMRKNNQQVNNVFCNLTYFYRFYLKICLIKMSTDFFFRRLSSSKERVSVRFVNIIFFLTFLQFCGSRYAWIGIILVTWIRIRIRVKSRIRIWILIK